MDTSYFNRQEAEGIAAPITVENSESATDDIVLSVSVFNSETDKIPQQHDRTWADLCRRLRQSQQRNRKAGAQTWSPIKYKPGTTRGNDGVESISCAVIDVEHQGPFESIKDRLDGYAFIAHSSFRHTADDPRYRIVLPLVKPSLAVEWPEHWERINHWLGRVNDPATKDLARVYFIPCHPTGGQPFSVVGQGRPLDISQLPELPEGFVVPGSHESATCGASRRIKIEGIEESPPDQLNPAIGLSRIVERCAFMQWASDPDNQNNVSYPLWRAMISNACRFEDSETWIYEASCHYAEYDKLKTDNLIVASRDFQAPITCQNIRENGFSGCPAGGCKTRSGQTTGAPAGLRMKALGGVPADSAADSTDLVERQFGSFVLTADGVFKSQIKDGDEFRIKIASFIEITAQTRDAAGTNWGLLITVKDPDGNLHEWAMPSEMLPSPKEWKSELLKLGAVICQNSGKPDWLYEYFLESMPTDRALCVQQPGWYENVFVLPNHVIGRSTGERVVLQSRDTSIEETFRSNGTLADWQQNVGTLCAGNSRLVLVTCAALTGPVLSLLGHENGGFHIYGGTSTGKTTAVEVAASVWGKRSKFVRNWRATGNAIEGVATRHNDTLLILDEISQVRSDEAGEIAYMLGNGRGKGRASISGAAKSITQWRLIYLSTGEQTLAEHMQNSGKRIMAGQEVRLVNLPAVANAGMGLFENIHSVATAQQFATLLKKNTDEFYGVAGPAFVEALANQDLQSEYVDTIRESIRTFIDTSIPAEASSQVQRVGQRFALVGAVGELAIQLGILPWIEGEARTAARTCFQAWIDERGGVASQENDQAIAQVRRFLETHGESRFRAWDDSSDNNADGRTINRAGFRRVTNDDRTEYYVLPEAFRTEICHGLNPKEVTKALRNAGFLKLGTNDSNQRQERLPGMGSVKVYVIGPDIFSGTD